MTPHERLLFLADALEKDAADPKGMMFDLTDWLIGPGRPIWKLGLGEKPQPQRSCGTVGCAVGLAMLLPEFEAEGLTYVNCKPNFAGYTHWAAVQEFFQLDESHAHWLFSSVSYLGQPVTGSRAELEVAKRIRQLVAPIVQTPETVAVAVV